MQRAALQHATGSIATCNGQHCNMRKRQDSKFEMQKQKIGCNGQHCNMQQAEPTTRNVATWYFNLQHAALLQPAACNTHSG
jgi:hypothetical protein